MAKRKFKRPKTAKEIAGKVDYVEDILGTEELSGTYEARERQAKMHERERLWVEDLKRQRYQELRKKREAELQQTLSDTEKYHVILQKMEYLMQYVLEPAAFEYVQSLYLADKVLCQKLMMCIFQPDQMDKLDGYIERIVKTGKGPKQKIKLTYLLRLVRELKGIKPKIMVERDGKREELFKGRKVA